MVKEASTKHVERVLKAQHMRRPIISGACILRTQVFFPKIEGPRVEEAYKRGILMLSPTLMWSGHIFFLPQRQTTSVFSAAKVRPFFSIHPSTLRIAPLILNSSSFGVLTTMFRLQTVHLQFWHIFVQNIPKYRAQDRSLPHSCCHLLFCIPVYNDSVSKVLGYYFQQVSRNLTSS